LIFKDFYGRVTVRALVAGNIGSKDNFGVNNNHCIIFTISTALIIIGTFILFSVYDRVNFYLTKIEEGEQMHKSSHIFKMSVQL